MILRQKKRTVRHNRVRSKISGSSERPRLCVFRSNAFVYAQVIDDAKHSTILSASDKNLPASAKKGTKIERASKIGEHIAKLALEKKITTVNFDRGGYKYHGRVKALAEGARKGGLIF